MKTVILVALLLAAVAFGAYALLQASAGNGTRPYDTLALACGVVSVLVLAFV